MSERPDMPRPGRAEEARGRLDALPTAGLGHWPTPFHRLNRLSELLAPQTPSGEAEVWIKRDDVQGVALAGNKLRKFDLVLGAALVDGADTLITTGAAQSNSARTGAAGATACGMESVLVLRGDEPDESTGNLFLDRLVGAETRFVGDRDWADMNRIVEEIADELTRQGRRPVTAPVGCSNPLGTLGFARAFLELDAQLVERVVEMGGEPSCIVHTSTSGGTHAGLLVGRALSGRDIPIIAIDAGQLFGRDPRPAVLALAREAAELIGLELDLGVDDLDMRLDYIGDGYGVTTDQGREAIDLLASVEAIVTDPVYSGKGAAGLIDLLRTGSITGPIVFWHTGGYHAMFDPEHGASVLAG